MAEQSQRPIRKRARSFMAAALIAAIGLPAVGGVFSPDRASAADFSIGDTVFVNTDALNLRDAAGTSADVLEVLATDTSGVVTDGPETADGYDWYELDVEDGQSGWVASDFIALQAGEDPGFSQDDTVQVIDGNLNLREEPSLSGAILEVLPDGTELTVTSSAPEVADGITWYEVTSDDFGAGWVAGGFLELVEGTPTTDFDIGSILLVETDNLNLREDPGIDGVKIGQLFNGDEVTVVGGPEDVDGYTWYKIETDLGTGWSIDPYFTDTGEQADDGGDTDTGGDVSDIEVGAVVQVIDGNLKLREAAGVDAAEIDTLPEGMELTVTDGPVSADGYTWFEVDGDYGLGWVAGEFLEVVTPAPAATETPTV